MGSKLNGSLTSPADWPAPQGENAVRLGLDFTISIDCLELIPAYYGDKVDLAQLPQDDAVYQVV
jgi:hypothetical protein